MWSHSVTTELRKEEKKTPTCCVLARMGRLGFSDSVCPQLFRPQDLGACWPDLWSWPLSLSLPGCSLGSRTALPVKSSARQRGVGNRHHTPEPAVALSQDQLCWCVNIPSPLPLVCVPDHLKRGWGHELPRTGGASGKEPACQCRRWKRCGFDLWVRKIP